MNWFLIGNVTEVEHRPSDRSIEHGRKKKSALLIVAQVICMRVSFDLFSFSLRGFEIGQLLPSVSAIDKPFDWSLGPRRKREKINLTGRSVSLYEYKCTYAHTTKRERDEKIQCIWLSKSGGLTTNFYLPPSVKKKIFVSIFFLWLSNRPISNHCIPM